MPQQTTRAGLVRVLANALLVLVAFESVSLVYVVAMIAAGTPVPAPATPVELALLVAAFVLVRWIFVLPALLLVLIGLEYVARRVPHARVLTAVIAFAPMVLWELTNSPSAGAISEQGVVLGVTAVAFAVLARLPARSAVAGPPAERAVAPESGAVAPSNLPEVQ